MSDVRKGGLNIFDILDWYVQKMMIEEEKKLTGYVMEVSCVMKARLFRLLDCTAYCIDY